MLSLGREQTSRKDAGRRRPLLSQADRKDLTRGREDCRHCVHRQRLSAYTPASILSPQLGCKALWDNNIVLFSNITWVRDQHTLETENLSRLMLILYNSWCCKSFIFFKWLGKITQQTRTISWHIKMLCNSDFSIHACSHIRTQPRLFIYALASTVSELL